MNTVLLNFPILVICGSFKSRLGALNYVIFHS